MTAPGFNVIGSPAQLLERQAPPRAPTITAIKREARRVFGKPSTVELDAPFSGCSWLLTLTVGDSLELRVAALTKKGAVADLFDLLRGLHAAPPDVRVLARVTGAVEGTQLHLELQGLPHVERPMDGCVEQEFPDRPAVIDVDYKHSADTGELVVGVVRFRPAVTP